MYWQQCIIFLRNEYAELGQGMRMMRDKDNNEDDEDEDDKDDKDARQI